MTRIFTIGYSLLALGVAACGASQTEAETPANEASATGATPAVKWQDMNRGQRMEFMGLTVMPEMKKLFVENDSEGYADFKCQSCHGEDMQKVDYKMPNGLFELSKPDPIPDSKEYDEAITMFMMNKVVPRMSELLQMTPAKEFTCFSCHETEE